jgi:7,8-dihydropterin-6-yl-methyl-4-(beta-D-ribofuranosyl)aminobenzene 5'-phosphate synthase
MPAEDSDRARITLTEEEYEIEPGIALFSVPDICLPMPLGNRTLFGRTNDGNYIPDDFLHEQNVLIQKEGVSLLIAGCAHRGIPNILNWVNERFKIHPQYIIGGFHLSHYSDHGTDGRNQLQQFTEYLKRSGAMCYTGHCTGIGAYLKLKKILGDRIEYAYAGRVINITDKEKKHE